MEMRRCFLLATWLLIWFLLSGINVALAATPAPTATPAWEPLITTPTPAPTESYTCPLPGQGIDGWGTVTPSAYWWAQCGQCVPTVYPMFTPTPETTPMPATTPTPTATPTPTLDYWVGEWYQCTASTSGGWSGTWSCGDIVIPEGAAGIVTALLDYSGGFYHIDGRAITGNWDRSARLQDGSVLVSPYCVADSYHGYRAVDVCSSYAFRGENWLKLGEHAGSTLSVGGYYDTHDNNAPPGSITYAVAFIYDSSRVPPGPTPTPTPVPVSSYCSSVAPDAGASADVLSDIFIRYPSISSPTCFTVLPEFDVPDIVIRAVPFVAFEGDYHFPGVFVCVRQVSFGVLNLGVATVDLDTLSLAVFGIAVLKFLFT